MFRSTFTARLGRAIEFNYTPTGTPAASLSCAISRGKGKDPLWVDVKLYGKPAEILGEMNPPTGTLLTVSIDSVPNVRQYTNGKKENVAVIVLIADWIECAYVQQEEAKT